MWPFKNKRQIYKFWDGSRKRTIDPLIVQRAFDTDPKFRVDVDLEMLEAGDVESLDTTLAAIRRAFGVQEWTEEQSGLTQLETLTLYRDFCIYMIALKKKHQPFADLACLYGTDVRNLDHECVVGLWLNRDRAATRQSERVRRGVESVMSTMFGGSGIDEQWCQHIAETPEEGKYLFHLRQAQIEMNKRASKPHQNNGRM